MKVVTKPWGREEWIAHNDTYVLKLIWLNKGFRTSLQYHEQKRETNYVDWGRIVCWLQDETGEIRKTEMGPGAIIDVEPGTLHRIEALEDTRLIEVSTPHVDDVIRVADDSNRGDGRIASEHGPDSAGR